MRHNALDTMEQYGMLRKGDRVVVGFSGGADSAALLSFLLELRQEWQLNLVACHINHQLRGEEALRDEEFCRNFCEERGIELHIFRENIAEGAKQAGMSVEEFARERRYARFRELLLSDSDKIATAHHGNDMAETLLFRLARGTGLKGLTGIPPVRGNIIRPLLFCTREEIESYCREQGIPYINDSSNDSEEFSRNRIRHQVIPQLEKLNPSFIKTILRTTKQLSLEENYLEEQCRQTMEEMLVSENCWDREKFLNLHPAMQQRIAAKWLEYSAAELSAEKVEDVLHIIKKKAVLELRKERFLAVDERHIVLKTAPKLQEFFSKPFQIGETELFSGKKVFVSELNGDNFELFANNRAKDLKNAFDYDKMCGNAVWRQKLPGDRLHLPGHRSATSLKKLLNQHKIPLEERSRMAVLADEKGLLWLEGFGVREDALPDENSRKILLIRIEEQS